MRYYHKNVPTTGSRFKKTTPNLNGGNARRQQTNFMLHPTTTMHTKTYSPWGQSSPKYVPNRRTPNWSMLHLVQDPSSLYASSSSSFQTATAVEDIALSLFNPKQLDFLPTILVLGWIILIMGSVWLWTLIVPRTHFIDESSENQFPKEDKEERNKNKKIEGSEIQETNRHVQEESQSSDHSFWIHNTTTNLSDLSWRNISMDKTTDPPDRIEQRGKYSDTMERLDIGVEQVPIIPQGNVMDVVIEDDDEQEEREDVTIIQVQVHQEPLPSIQPQDLQFEQQLSTQLKYPLTTEQVGQDDNDSPKDSYNIQLPTYDDSSIVVHNDGNAHTILSICNPDSTHDHNAENVNGGDVEEVDEVMTTVSRWDHGYNPSPRNDMQYPTSDMMQKTSWDVDPIISVLSNHVPTENAQSIEALNVAPDPAPVIVAVEPELDSKEQYAKFLKEQIRQDMDQIRKYMVKKKAQKIVEGEKDDDEEGKNVLLEPWWTLPTNHSQDNLANMIEPASISASPFLQVEENNTTFASHKLRQLGSYVLPRATDRNEHVPKRGSVFLKDSLARTKNIFLKPRSQSLGTAISSVFKSRFIVITALIIILIRRRFQAFL